MPGSAMSRWKSLPASLCRRLRNPAGQGREVVGVAQRFGGDLAFADSRAARHHASAMPSRLVTKYSFRPQQKRECEGQ
ncbi:hypothetical protein A8924_2991 [Saccharopolyspora erythraea NRRL 2338]|nr:hypothetical protein A8924_2991 [Saccharopolyspora erythraea NRRL 2338]